MTESNENLKATPRLVTIEPVLPVPDIAAATSYYRDTLDFSDVWNWGEPPSHGGANRDGVQIQFTLTSDSGTTPPKSEVWLRVQNVAGLFELHQERGADVIAPLQATPWGVSQYTLRDLNDYFIHFAGNIDERRTGSPPLPVQISSLPPTWTEMEVLIRAVGWQLEGSVETAARVLEVAVGCAVARSKGRMVGCAFAATDGAGFYYVRDVMVHPDWQGLGIGSRLLQRLIESLEAIAPDGSRIGLFTGDHLHDFYSRFGFNGPRSGWYGMTRLIK